MRILHCDFCHAEVNDYGHWYNEEKARNMYELKCVHEGSLNTFENNTFEDMIICHKCLKKLLCKTESEEA